MKYIISEIRPTFLTVITAVAYTKDEVQYVWKHANKSIIIDKGMRMSQFDLIATPVSNETLTTSIGCLFILLLSEVTEVNYFSFV